MTVIGLTGGSGSGKGYVSRFFEARGIPCLDTDLVSREVCRAGSACLRELCKAFGEDILLEDGEMDRARVRDIVFNDANKLSTLNSITHRYILDECRRWLSEQSRSYPAAIIDAPLLYESGFDAECDVTVAVTADTDTRISRIISRDRLDRDSALRRLQNQHDNEFYRKNADYIITNDASTEKEELTRQVDAIIKVIGVSKIEEKAKK